MRRDRFLQISRFLHCADNMNINTTDKMYKLRPLIEKLKVNFLKSFQSYQYLSYDESMIKYYGRHGCKQFLRGKPIRFGYKACCLTTDFGYLQTLIYIKANLRIKTQLTKTNMVNLLSH